MAEMANAACCSRGLASIAHHIDSSSYQHSVVLGLYIRLLGSHVDAELATSALSSQKTEFHEYLVAV